MRCDRVGYCLARGPAAVLGILLFLEQCLLLIFLRRYTAWHIAVPLSNFAFACLHHLIPPCGYWGLIFCSSSRIFHPTVLYYWYYLIDRVAPQFSISRHPANSSSSLRSSLWIQPRLPLPFFAPTMYRRRRSPSDLVCRSTSFPSFL